MIPAGYVESFLETVPTTVTSLWDLSKYSNWQKQNHLTKGNTGERFIVQYLKDYYDIEAKIWTEEKDFDILDITNNLKVEVKTSFAAIKRKCPQGLLLADTWSWNHIGIEKEWDVLALIGINHELDECMHHKRGWRPPEEREEMLVAFFTKQQFIKSIEQGHWSISAGGNKSDNDDWVNKSTFIKNTNYFSNYRNYPHSKNIS